jgi:hypothetical protein
MKLPITKTTMCYNTHAEFVSKHIKTYADFQRYLIHIDNAEYARMLIADYANRIPKNTMNSSKVEYISGEIPAGNDIILIVKDVNDVIPFYANVICIDLRCNIDNPELFTNYAHLMEVRIHKNAEIDSKKLARIFPNLRKVEFGSQCHMEKSIVYFPNISQVMVKQSGNKNPIFFAKYRDVEFIFEQDEDDEIDYLIDEPNVKFRFNMEIIFKQPDFTRIADKIVEMKIDIFLGRQNDTRYDGFLERYTELRALAITNTSKSHLVISNMMNLETLAIHTIAVSENRVTLANNPYLRTYIRTHNGRIFFNTHNKNETNK